MDLALKKKATPCSNSNKQLGGGRRGGVVGEDGQEEVEVEGGRNIDHHILSFCSEP